MQNRLYKGSNNNFQVNFKKIENQKLTDKFLGYQTQADASTHLSEDFQKNRDFRVSSYPY